ncbi:uncharacterized protein LOC114524170 [Dendronephthya gigantea]|uniref:uncharacterized protein LOC114524170 n=1 Tax=Dendronephthya gigantea TaxID=151771 RepID=UPI00106B5A62|nr:uncharacterized protein LOC114524170 [Dendronephthya gigantea]
MPCPKDEYQPHEGKLRCIPCPENHVTKREGALDPRQCLIGEIELPTAKAKDATTKEESTTKAVFDNLAGDDHGTESKTQLIIGLSLGGFFLLLFVTGIVLVRRRWKRVFIPNKSTKKREKLTAETCVVQDYPATVCSFANVIYDESSKTDENVILKDVDEDFHSSPVDKANTDSSESGV